MRKPATPMRPARCLISVAVTAQTLGVSVSAVRKWIRLGQLPHLRLGRRVMLDPCDVEALIRAAETPSKHRTAADGR